MTGTSSKTVLPLLDLLDPGALRRADDTGLVRVSLWEKDVEAALNRESIEACRETVELLRKVQEAMTRLDCRSEFDGFLESVRAAHKPKRNFMKLLDGGKWG